jgi:hypothetical protein
VVSSGIEPARGGDQHEPADLLGMSRGSANRHDAAHGLGDQIAGSGELACDERDEIIKTANRVVARLVA